MKISSEEPNKSEKINSFPEYYYFIILDINMQKHEKILSKILLSDTQGFVFSFSRDIHHLDW